MAVLSVSMEELLGAFVQSCLGYRLSDIKNFQPRSTLELIDTRRPQNISTLPSRSRSRFE